MARKQNPDAIRAEFERATQDLRAWLVQKDGETVAKIVVKYGGRTSPHGLTVRAFVHVIGLPMVRGIARGGGYDMKSAAILSACGHITYNLRSTAYEQNISTTCADFRALKDNGYDVPRQLRDMGYQVEWVI